MVISCVSRYYEGMLKKEWNCAVDAEGWTKRFDRVSERCEVLEWRTGSFLADAILKSFSEALGCLPYRGTKRPTRIKRWRLVSKSMAAVLDLLQSFAQVFRQIIKGWRGMFKNRTLQPFYCAHTSVFYERLLRTSRHCATLYTVSALYK